MVSLIKYGGHQNKNDMSFVGKSTDTKPIKIFDGMPISNGSKVYELDTQKTFMYDEDMCTWVDVTGLGNGESSKAYTAGDGISISEDGVISVTILNGNEVSY